MDHPDHPHNCQHRPVGAAKRSCLLPPHILRPVCRQMFCQQLVQVRLAYVAQDARVRGASLNQHLIDLLAPVDIELQAYTPDGGLLVAQRLLIMIVYFIDAMPAHRYIPVVVPPQRTLRTREITLLLCERTLTPGTVKTDPGLA